MDNFDQNDRLWNLLGRAKPTQASPYFTRKVLRAVQDEPAREPSFNLWSLLRWLIPASACAAILLGWMSYHSADEAQTAEFNEQFTILADLPALVINDDARIWIEG